jgi:hypothetical protein
LGGVLEILAAREQRHIFNGFADSVNGVAALAQI